jgi:hypothetical protein
VGIGAIVDGFPIDPVVEAAMDYAEKIAEAQADKGED